MIELNLPEGMDFADLEEFAKAIDEANPDLRKTFENVVKNNVDHDELDEFIEEVKEIFDHNSKP